MGKKRMFRLHRWAGLLLAVMLVLTTVAGCSGKTGGQSANQSAGQQNGQQIEQSANGSNEQVASDDALPEPELDPWDDEAQQVDSSDNEAQQIEDSDDEVQQIIALDDDQEAGPSNDDVQQIESSGDEDQDVQQIIPTDEGTQDGAQSGTNGAQSGTNVSQSGTNGAQSWTDEAQETIDERGTYTTKEDVALYIHTYGKLPENFITKKQARKLGWEGGYLEPYAPGKCIGGDVFTNIQECLPEGNYRECDIDTLGRKKRGAKRLVFSDDGRIYYTSDHYKTFTQLY